jgi:heme-degrading monooxygenase HmoA
MLPDMMLARQNVPQSFITLGGSMQHKTPSVVGLFFEVQPKPGQQQAYFDHVDWLKPSLATHDGLFWMQRYQSMDDLGLILSHQYWVGEQALAAWRQNADHRHAQMQGMSHIFADYRTRVGSRVWHWDGEKDAGFLAVGPAPERPYILTLHMAADCDASAIAAGLSVISLSFTGRFESVADDKSGLIMAACADFTASIYQHILRCGATSAALFAPTRDYGLFDRQAAPAPAGARNKRTASS